MKFELSRLRGGRSFTSRLTFRAKLLLVLFVPFLALVVVVAAGLSDRFTALDAQRQYGDLSGSLRKLDDASRALQNENVVSAWYVASNGAPAAELAKARARTNAAVRAFHAAEPAFVSSGMSGAAAAALEATNQAFSAIRYERSNMDAGAVTAASTREFFLGADDHLLDFGAEIARGLASNDAAASLTRVFSLERAEHDLAREASISIAVLASGASQSAATDFSEWIGAQAAQSEHLRTFANTATSDEVAAYASVVGTSTAAALPTAFPASSQTPGEHYVDYRRASDALDRAIGAVQDVVDRTASTNASSALRDVRLYGGGAVLAMLLTLLLIWFVSRAVVGPVRRLTAAAREMSQRQLPALVESLRTGGDVSEIQPVHIDVKSHDEIGELAQAFNDVEAVTLQVAQEQSQLLRKGMGDLFVNLARRNQSLVQRQLELLDELEHNEHDPSALDALFKLDHMATRMRRNAESLLVLSGAEQPRQWHEPIALIDVVRAAAAEITDFARVELVGIDDELAVSGRAVSDVAHLLAELLENATAFSPPDTPVVVSGTVSATGFVIAVTDQGIGMTPDRIAEANTLLADPPVVGLALSRALGLHVVGLLAARHDIGVELRAATPSGLVALVGLPTAVLEPRPSTSAPASTPASTATSTPASTATSMVASGPRTGDAVVGTPVAGRALEDDGDAALAARRLVARPPDEPPVEEWGWEGLTDVPTGAPPAPVEPPAPDVPVGTFAASAAYDDLPRDDVPRDDMPLDETRPDAPAAVPFTEPPLVDPPFADGDPGADPGAEPGAEPGPLPTRIPGRHMVHLPLAGPEAVHPNDDPMRPYRVHELLTRHAQGKRRGQVGDASHDHLQEDGTS